MWKFKLVNLGCKVNSYEVDLLTSLIVKEYTLDEQHPTVIIVNSCCVTKVAENKSCQKIRSLRSTYPNAIIILLGCLAQLDFTAASKLPADLIINNAGKDTAWTTIKQFLISREVVPPSTFSATYPSNQQCLISRRTRMQVKIADGCRHRCTYCLVSLIRGPFRSRTLDDILNEINTAVDNGIKEVVLTGIDSGSYGVDINSSIVNLIKAILNETTLERLRISSIEFTQVSDDLINLIVLNPRIAHHLHIPLQSGSNTVLKRMNRHYQVEDFLNLIKKLNTHGVTCSTDIIVGFPEESEEEFKQTLSFVKQAKFIKCHIFPYSIRPGTPAAKMNQLSSQIKKERAAMLNAAALEISHLKLQTFTNQIVEVLIEEIKNGIGYGFSSQYFKASVKGAHDCNTFYRAKVISINSVNAVCQLIDI